jgi:ribonuclease HI/2C-methyl-D-erythritol 2,4-cyclodiphosphate synthase
VSTANPLAGLRVGSGMAATPVDGGLPPCLGGVSLQTGADSPPTGADVISNAALDALLSACGLPGLTVLLDPIELASAQDDAFLMLSCATTALGRQKLQAVLNIDLKLASAFHLAERDRAAIVSNLAAALDIHATQVSLSMTPRYLDPQVDQGQTVAAFAYVLCAMRAPHSGVSHPAVKAQVGQTYAPEATGAITLEELPAGRPREFERAVRTKLPPLPAAPPPGPGEMLIVYTDGASRGNPGPAAAGWVVLDSVGRLVGEGGKVLGEHTNNQAEYMAVQEAASWIEQNLGREFQLLIRSDSELIVKQLRGEYKVKDAELKELALETISLLLYFNSFELHAVPRKENSRADALANQALDDAKANRG